MCGIIGYIGERKASEVLLKGLKTLEYRGYDSVGMAVDNETTIEIKKDKGMVEEVNQRLDFTSLEGKKGIGHTRWATHGRPTKENAHPHSDCTGNIAIVHNGVLENYQSLRKELISKGHKLKSETDSELIAHILEDEIKENEHKQAFLNTINKLKGSFAIVSIIKNDNHLYTAKRNSPLVIGVGENEVFALSDITAGLDYTKRFIPLNENEVAILSPNSVELLSIKGEPISREPMVVEWSKEMAEKSGFPHFMLKEINEQPASAKESFSSDISPILSSLQKYQDIDIVACGTSYHTSLHLKYLLEKFLSKRANAVIASEYQYTSSPSENTFVLAISQSGETADTMAALRYAKKKGAHIIAITNVVGSSITRLADKTVFLNAGPEVSVAATKTFTSQLALAFKIVFPEKDFSEVSEILKDSLHLSDKIKEISKTLINKQNVFFIGRAQSFPITLEGALKFKEISYIHAEAYPGGELKHGPISLIEEKTPVIVFAPSDETVEKLLGNIREVKARGAYVISFTDSEEIMNESDESIRIITPREKEFYPFSFIIPLQLLAYHASVLRGINPDRPRNLAKSVTVE